MPHTASWHAVIDQGYRYNFNGTWEDCDKTCHYGIRNDLGESCAISYQMYTQM